MQSSTGPDRLPRYDYSRTYDYNYSSAPEPVEVEAPAIPGDWQFCGLSVDSPLGIPAGPLLNGRWILYYASLGFDILTYKTVRSVARACYPLPNLLPVTTATLMGDEERLPAAGEMAGTWAVSFGMPSKAPEQWRTDIEQTRRQLPRGKLLVVSVVGTTRSGWTIEDLARDYADCARWAVDSGADMVETNYSCPNVSSRDGQLYQEPKAMEIVSSHVRDRIGSVPYMIKIGHVRSDEETDAVLRAVGPYVDALAMTNSIATTVVGPDGGLLFDGQRRGICGDATREASMEQVRRFAAHAKKANQKLSIAGVGGAHTADHVQAYLQAGAGAVLLATSIMVNPAAGLEIRRNWSCEANPSGTAPIPAQS